MAVSLIAIFVVCAWLFFTSSHDVKIDPIDVSLAGKESAKTALDPKINKIHMAAMGDMLAHDTIISNAVSDDSYDFGKYFKNIKNDYNNSDLVFCNQEGLSAGEQYGISGYPSFNAPQQFAAGLQSGAGCNVINLANNHMGDKGVAATNATIDAWNVLKPIAVSGANKNLENQSDVAIAIVNGIRIGFVSFADFNNNKATPSYSVNNYHDEALVRDLITKARASADVVIVSMHWGVEDSTKVSAEQQSEVSLLSSLGVDLILGTGPHVLQKVETVDRPDGGKTVVWYSLGNMLSSQLAINELIGGIAQFDITKNSEQGVTISNLSFTPTYMHYEWTASEAENGNLAARKNVMIYLLSEAIDPLSRSLFNTTIAEQKQSVVDILGPEVTVR
jgi:poly-gamma-glutamate synthesis protein (capsule biosynthesis protein)